MDNKVQINDMPFDTDAKMPIYKQIVQFIADKIERDIYKKDHQLLSINEFSKQYSVARDTIERAYKVLKKEGYIVPVLSKGYFVAGKKDDKIKVLIVLNKLSSYKKIIYYSFLETLGNRAKVDLQVHHYNPTLFREIVEASMGKYHYYVVMPHFLQQAAPSDYLEVIGKIPSDGLMLLDKNLPGFPNHMSVYQDFDRDIYDALESGIELMEKYRTVNIVFPEIINHPPGILDGARAFCKRYKKAFKVIDDVNETRLAKGSIYILTSEEDLALLIKKIRNSDLVMGKDVGIISFNETVLKELLGITVITTDFEQMGKTAAQLILNGTYGQVKNPFNMIKRNSL